MRVVEVSGSPRFAATHVGSRSATTASAFRSRPSRTVFQRFTRAHTGRQDLQHVGGIGLGLSIVEDCVGAMGGQIHLRLAEHEGTVFVVTLPTTPGIVAPPPSPNSL